MKNQRIIWLYARVLNKTFGTNGITRAETKTRVAEKLEPRKAVRRRQGGKGGLRWTSSNQMRRAGEKYPHNKRTVAKDRGRGGRRKRRRSRINKIQKRGKWSEKINYNVPGGPGDQKLRGRARRRT